LMEMGNAITFPQRTPGLWSPLHCFADVPHYASKPADIDWITHTLINAASQSTLFQQNTKKNTFLHLAVARGNLQLVRSSIEQITYLWSRDQATELANLTNEKGKTILDLAYYNAEIKTFFKNLLPLAKGQTPDNSQKGKNAYIPHSSAMNRKFHRAITERAKPEHREERRPRKVQRAQAEDERPLARSRTPASTRGTPSQLPQKTLERERDGRLAPPPCSKTRRTWKPGGKGW
jgi:ankyrin repeat protein